MKRKWRSWTRGQSGFGIDEVQAEYIAEIKLRKSEAKKMLRLNDKVAAQRVIKDLEKKRAEKRQNLYEAQDEVDAKKENLLSSVEKMLEQKIEQEELFTIRWRVI